MRTLEVVLFTASLVAAGLVVFALVYSGVGPYEDMAKSQHVQAITFIRRDGTPLSFDLAAVLDVHRLWSSYVTGGADAPPQFAADIRFTDDEYAHMADVRRVFDGAKLLVPIALFVIIIRLQRARMRGARDMWRLVRTSSLAAVALVIAIGIVAAFAFEPLFLLFHYVFFPQGNFLFDPATSNLVRLYPDWYWEGITLRVGASFVVVMLALAGVAHLRVVRGLA